MKANSFRISAIFILISSALAGFICAILFNTPFAKKTVDYFSFAAALFLMAEGFYAISCYRAEKYFPRQLLRHARIIIGVSIFTIHVMQVIYGV